MFRLKVSDKFGHVLSKLQAMITSNQKYCSQINLPKFIILEDLDKNEGLQLRARIDSIYKEKELTVAVCFEQTETTITLLGVSRRSWAYPTLGYEEAVNFGLEYKGFHLPLATIINPSAKKNMSIERVQEILHINIVNLQMKVESEFPDQKYHWCNWVQKLPIEGSQMDEKLPQWMSDRSVKKTCEYIIDARKLIKLAKERGKEYQLDDMPPLELANDLLDKSDKTKKKMEGINNWYNDIKIKIIQGGERNGVDKNKAAKDDEIKTYNEEPKSQEEIRRSFKEYQQRKNQEEREKQRKKDEEFQNKISHTVQVHNELKNEDHESKVSRYRSHLDNSVDTNNERRVRRHEANQVGKYEEENRKIVKEYEERMRAKKVSEYNEKEHILDSSPPNIKRDEELLMPRPSSPPTRSAPWMGLTTHFPPPPPAFFSSYPWSVHSHNPGWDNRTVTVDWYSCEDLLEQAEQLNARAAFVKEQKEKERFERNREKERLEKREKEELERRKKKEEQDNDMTRYRRVLDNAKRHVEEEKYKQFIKDKEEKKLQMEAKKQQEKQNYEKFKSYRKTNEPQYEEIKDNEIPDPHDQRITVTMPGDIEPLVARPSRSARRPLFDRAPEAQSEGSFQRTHTQETMQRQEAPDISLPPPGFGTVTRHVRPVRPLSDHSGSQDWSGLSYLGPRFPSLEREMEHEDELLPRIIYKKKMEMLRQLTEDRLREVTTLEGSIHETVYNTNVNQPPCSLLARKDVVCASQCPQLLPGSTREKILSMKEILELIEEKRQEHMETLDWLQKQPQHKLRELVTEQDEGTWDTVETEEDNENDDENIVTLDDDIDDEEDDTQAHQRTSNRLAQKPRVNYQRLNEQGKDDEY